MNDMIKRMTPKTVAQGGIVYDSYFGPDSNHNPVGQRPLTSHKSMSVDNCPSPQEI
jgi:hypothetical protein